MRLLIELSVSTMLNILQCTVEPCGGDGNVAATRLAVANLFTAQMCSVLFSPSTDASKTGGVFRALQKRMFYPPLV